jgi:hypothetical protein
MTWSEFISLRFEQFFLLLALRPNIVKDVRKAICDVKVISSLVKLDKSSLTFSPRSLRQEFCNLYVAKLKVRTNQKGEIAAV